MLVRLEGRLLAGAEGGWTPLPVDGMRCYLAETLESPRQYSSVLDKVQVPVRKENLQLKSALQTAVQTDMWAAAMPPIVPDDSADARQLLVVESFVRGSTFLRRIIRFISRMQRRRLDATIAACGGQLDSLCCWLVHVVGDEQKHTQQQEHEHADAQTDIPTQTQNMSTHSSRNVKPGRKWTVQP